MVEQQCDIEIKSVQRNWGKFRPLTQYFNTRAIIHRLICPHVIIMELWRENIDILLSYVSFFLNKFFFY